MRLTWRESTIYDDPKEYLEKVLRPKYEFRGTLAPYQFCQKNGIGLPHWVKDCSSRHRKGQRAFSPYDCMKVAEAKLLTKKL